MDSISEEMLRAVTPDLRSAWLRWLRFTNQAMADAVKIGQPVFEAYIHSLAKAVPDVEKLARGYCDIPETECPPYCICHMDWEACEGETVTGTVEVRNTGEKGSSFALTAGSFRSSRNNSGVTPQLNPSTFSLAPGESKTVTVSVAVDGEFHADELYESELKIAGRYEQCVRLSLQVRPQRTPHCEVEHGEIPTRIVAHHWYDHFQCEELCFEPVTVGRPAPKPDTKPATGAPAANVAGSAKRSSRKKGA